MSRRHFLGGQQLRVR